MTNQEKLNQLREELKELNYYISENNLEEKYSEFINSNIDKLNMIQPILKEDWETMTSEEQEEKFLYYYWSRRTEYTFLIKTMTSVAHDHMTNIRSVKEAVDAWLNNSWVRFDLGTLAVASGIITMLSGVESTTVKGQQLNDKKFMSIDIDDGEDAYKNLFECR